MSALRDRGEKSGVKLPALIGVIAALKLSLLALFGPIWALDTVGYTDFAAAITSGTAWLYDAGLSISARPITVSRIIGYPVLIAACAAAAGEGWRWLLVIFQIIVSLAAVVRFYALRPVFGLSPGTMLWVVAAYATSVPLLLDATVLTDSLHASLIIILIASLALTASAGRPLRAGAALRLGALLAAAFLLREAASTLWLAVVPLLVCALGLGGRSGTTWRGRLAAGALFLMPLAAAHAAYIAWNAVRTGQPFVTTSAQTALIQPLVEAASIHPAIFSGELPLDQAARESLKKYDFTDVLPINDLLYDRWHYSALNIADIAVRAYLAAWRDYPLTMMRVVAGHFREGGLFLLFRPIDALREYILWATGKETEWGRSKSIAVDRRMLPLFVADRACKFVSSALMAAFLVLTPWRAWRDREAPETARIGLALWLLCLIWTMTYAAVHLETRYLAPLIPFAILVGVANVQWEFRRIRWRMRRRSLNPIPSELPRADAPSGI